MAFTPQEFAAKVRAKYPDAVDSTGRAYRDIPDDELSRRIVEKHPVYESQVKFPGPFESTVKDVGDSFSQRQTNVQDVKDRVGTGKTSLGEGFLQVLGEGAGFLGDAGFDVIKNIFKPEIRGKVAGEVEKITNSPIAQDLAQKYSIWKEANPNLAEDLEAVINIGGILTAGTGGAASKTAFKSLEKGIEKKMVGPTMKAEALVQGTKESIKKNLSPRSWMVSNAPASVETVLKETPQKMFDRYVDLAKKAVTDNKSTTPLEYAGFRAQEALDQVQRKLQAIGKQKGSIIASAEGRKPVGDIVLKYRQNLQNASKNKSLVEGDNGLVNKVLEKAQALGANPNAQQVDQFIDYVQDAIYTSRRDLTVPVTDEVTAMLRKATGELNQSLKSKLPKGYSTLNDKYSRLVDLRNELNVKLGAEGEKGGSLMKRVFSPSDANTKKLFAEILDETGIDLVNEATVARFAAETFGDSRSASLLAQLNEAKKGGLSQTGIVGYALDKLIKMADSPEARIQKARSLTAPLKAKTQ